MGYTNEQLYNLSTKIINGSANCFFGEAYNVSYTDVYDFSSKKQSLKTVSYTHLPDDAGIPQKRRSCCSRCVK